MEIRRFFCSPEDIKDDILTLRGEEFLHAVKVLRQKVGYFITACTGDGKDRLCKITNISKDFLQADVIEVTENTAEPKVQVKLFMAVSKPQKLDIIIQKAVELGISDIQPFYSEFSEKTCNIERLNKIALEAAKQCGRSVLTEVRDAIAFDSVLRNAKDFDLAIFAYEKENQNALSDISFDNAGTVAIIVGAEGGFSETEYKKAKENGLQTVGLGTRILRTETACIALAAIVMHKVGELG